ncbi:MAG: hypothetical protein KGO49_06475 [Gammaproteobacteria bacterium]|nr:hypothetical protein [Gammaproteobacteria bacterium]
MIPLVKGSFFILCFAIIIITVIYIIILKKYSLAILSVCMPILSMCILSGIAGQSLSNLALYFKHIFPIISGYTEAMSLEGVLNEIYLFMASYFIISLFIFRASLDLYSKIFIFLCVSVFLYISFKAGFVRHDGHADISAIALLIIIPIISLEIKIKKAFIPFTFCLFASFTILSDHRHLSVGEMWYSIKNVYVNAYLGLDQRIKHPDFLVNKYNKAIDVLAEKSKIPALSGTTDIYSYDQAELLASHNTWNPRPVFQSYSAYTPLLAQMNESHLRGDHAPDNLLFKIQPIDNRLPSLEDGLSWAAIFDNYHPVEMKQETIYLQKNALIKSSSQFHVLKEQKFRTDEIILINGSELPVFAKIDLKLTLLGQIAQLLYKPPQLTMNLELRNGQHISYRVLSNMMRSGFFISPLVKDTHDFLLLSSGNGAFLGDNMVKSISITPAYGHRLLWNREFSLVLESYHNSSLPDPKFAPLINKISAVQPHYSLTSPDACHGVIDTINGLPPAAIKINDLKFLSVKGWLTLSNDHSQVPEKLFITFKSVHQPTQYVEATHTSRDDVKIYLKHPQMADVGYEALIDSSKLAKSFILGIAEGDHGHLRQCSQFQVPITTDLAH